jgi:hypothetical protein
MFALLEGMLPDVQRHTLAFSKLYYHKNLSGRNNLAYTDWIRNHSDSVKKEPYHKQHQQASEMSTVSAYLTR